jgi:divalent metal cation (Fe/Co/Zn/Cd) transporter
VREVHNVTVLDVGGHIEVSLHLKLPGEVTLEEAHEVANQVESAIAAAVPEVDSVQTHIEPLGEAVEGKTMEDDQAERNVVLRIVREITGEEPRELRFVRTDEGLLAYLTLGLDPSSQLAEAHARASEIEERIRRARPDIADVIVHTEP